jgi:hypothetical protein
MPTKHMSAYKGKHPSEFQFRNIGSAFNEKREIDYRKLRSRMANDNNRL